MLVMGIGNILLRDAGIGVRVIEYLQRQTMPCDVEIIDGKTVGPDLVNVLSGRRAVIIVDAVDFESPPGTILRMTPGEWQTALEKSLSLHDLDIPQTLAMTRSLGCAPETVICLGIVPEIIQPGMTLSQTLASLVPAIAQHVLEEISSVASDSSSVA